MMPGVNKAYRRKKLNSFATDLSMRCQSEFDNIHRLTKGDTEKLKKRISATTDAITECYNGNHRLCKTQSTVCMEESNNNWPFKSEHLPYFLNLR